MNSAPMIFRFASGSATPSSLASVCLEASTTVTGRCRLSLNIFITRSCSLYRSRPLSTKQQCKRSPRTLCTRVAATAESTPPERAQIACSSGPTRFFILTSCSSSTSAMDHVGLRAHTSIRKCCSVSKPRSECVTSGWYCRPYIFFSLFSIATMASCSLLATTLNPSGSTLASSPWLIHTDWGLCAAAPYMVDPGVMRMGMRPYSRLSAGSTLPPKISTINCMP
mmetsp:Transcript_21878/g.41792  ORF Transcript_21878/g.41792 Transcript_21878/m.41792 type:complete len:224 (+) Transcript_21878:674-1345(+)